ncbi:MAG: hypothetical protein KM310_08050 [Clostridiales bacterium]|nr:hypothetical protein [Clostridiales bacterium]
MKKFGIFVAVLGILLLLILAIGWSEANDGENTAAAVLPEPSTTSTPFPWVAGDPKEYLAGAFALKSEAPKPVSSAKKTDSAKTQQPSSSQTPKSPSASAPSPQNATESQESKTQETLPFAKRDLGLKVLEHVPEQIRYIYITADFATGYVVIQNASQEEDDLYSIPAEDFLAMTDAEREKALKDLLWRYWDAHPEKAPKPWGREDYAVPHTKDFLIPLRLWFPEWWFAHYDVDPCNDVVYWREVPACREVVKEQPTQSWLLNR